MINIPFPFVAGGTNPIKVHEDVTCRERAGKTCFSPKGKLLSRRATSHVGLLATADFGRPKQVTVESPEDGLVFIRIHIAYDLKGRARGCTKSGRQRRTRRGELHCTGRGPGFDIGERAEPDGYEQYLFTFSGTGDTAAARSRASTSSRRTQASARWRLQGELVDAVSPTQGRVLAGHEEGGDRLHG